MAHGVSLGLTPAKKDVLTVLPVRPQTAGSLDIPVDIRQSILVGKLPDYLSAGAVRGRRVMGARTIHRIVVKSPMYDFGLILQQTPAANSLTSFLPIILIVGIFYFLVFMPMQKQKKQQAAMLAGLQAGNEVVTTGGIVGTVVSVTDQTLILRVKPDNIKLQVARSAVASLVTSDKGEEKK